MIVCDECRKIEAKCFDCAIVVEKIDDQGRESGRRKKAAKPREIITIKVALCDPCLTNVCRNLGRLKAAGMLSGETMDSITGNAGRPSVPFPIPLNASEQPPDNAGADPEDLGSGGR